jgi:hypothetical protein
MSEIKKFNKNDGEFILSSRADELFKETKEAYKAAGVKTLDYTHSQFFGKNKLEELLRDAGSECAGFKFSFVLEDGKLNDLSLVVQAVDEDGNVLGGSGKKPGGSVALSGGPKCPRTCIPPLDPDQ